MVAKERNTLDKADVGNKERLAIVRIPAVADGKRVVDRDAQNLSVRVDCKCKYAFALRLE